MEEAQLEKVWLAASDSSRSSADDVMKFDLEKAAKLALTSDMSLRQEGNYMYGLARIWAARASLSLRESKEMDEGFGRAFKEYLEKISQENGSNSSPSKRATNLHDFNFDELSIPSSLLSDPISSSQNVGSDSGAEHSSASDSDMRRSDALRSEDLSFDDIMRADDDEQPVVGDIDTSTRSAEQEAVLANEMDSDFGGMDLEPTGPGELDFGPELEYSSSPPHTPLGSEDEGVAIRGEDAEAAERPPKPATRRRKQGAAIDEVTTIVRHNRPPARISRRTPEPPLNPVSIMSIIDDHPLGFDAEIEKMSDPEFVYAEMKRRRSAGSATQDSQDLNTDADAEMLDSEAPALDQGEDAGSEFDIGMELDTLELNSSESEEEDPEEITEEMIEAEEKHAKQVLKQQLSQRGKSVQFDDLARGPQSRASMFMEVLGQAAKGRSRAHQETPFGPIRSTRV